MTARRVRRGRLRGVARSVAALLVLGVLLAGLPVALYLVAGSPVPHAVPGLHQIGTALRRPDDGTLFFGAVRVVSWAAWAAFAVAAIVEGWAQLRGRHAPRLAGLGAMQRLAAYLVTSAALAFGSAVPAAFAASPAAHPPAAAAARTGEHIQIVRPRDTLSQIAQDDLGSWQRYPEIFRDSQHLAQPGGRRLTDPDLIYPGERLLIPGIPQPAHHRPPARPGTPAAAPAAMAPRPAASSPPDPAPGTARNPPSGPAAPGAQTPQASGQHERVSVPVAVIAGYDALLASGVVAVLALKRRIQQRRRKPGRRIRVPAAMSDTERGMRAAAEPGSVQLPDRALRSLAARMPADGGVLPALAGARVTAAGLQLLLAAPADPAPPFRPAGDDRWELDRGSPALLDAAQVREVPAPYPALVTLGDDASGAHVLADLVEVGAVCLHGQPDHILEVLTALAVEMATSPWADHIVVHCAGFAAGLPRALGTGRLHHAPGIDEILAGMEAHAREVAAVLAESGVDSVRAARSGQVAADAWTPEVILSAVPLTGSSSAGSPFLSRPTPTMRTSPRSSPLPGRAASCPGPGSWTSPRAARSASRDWTPRSRCSGSPASRAPSCSMPSSSRTTTPGCPRRGGRTCPPSPALILPRLVRHRRRWLPPCPRSE